MIEVSSEGAAVAEPPPTGRVAAASLGPIVIEPLRRRHLRGVLRIEEQTSHRPWSQRLFVEELDRPTERHYLVALDGATVVGFGGTMFTGAEAHLTTLAVDPVHQRRAVGTRLLLELVADTVARGVDAMTLEVRMSNVAAQELYRRFGFAPGGVRRGYYAEVGEDGLIMWAHDLTAPEYALRLADIAATLPVGSGREAAS
jgi:ribosomal-protein-alanine N-acetyltransferase